MAGKITELAAATGTDLTNTDLLEVVDVDDTSMAVTGTNKHVALVDLVGWMVNNTALPSDNVTTDLMGPATPVSSQATANVFFAALGGMNKRDWTVLIPSTPYSLKYDDFPNLLEHDSTSEYTVQIGNSVAYWDGMLFNGQYDWARFDFAVRNTGQLTFTAVSPQTLYCPTSSTKRTAGRGSSCSLWYKKGTGIWFLTGDLEIPATPGPAGVVMSPTPPADHSVLWADTSTAGVDSWLRWTGTQAQYDAIPVKDPNTLYVIV